MLLGSRFAAPGEDTLSLTATSIFQVFFILLFFSFFFFSDFIFYFHFLFSILGKLKSQSCYCILYFSVFLLYSILPFPILAISPTSRFRHIPIFTLPLPRSSLNTLSTTSSALYSLFSFLPRQSTFSTYHPIHSLTFTHGAVADRQRRPDGSPHRRLSRYTIRY